MPARTTKKAAEKPAAEEQAPEQPVPAPLPPPADEDPFEVVTVRLDDNHPTMRVPRCRLRQMSDAWQVVPDSAPTQELEPVVPANLAPRDKE